jgi:hypothetical protein
MPAADKITLADLKKLIKDHAKSLPKLSAGKQSLLLYADKAGLLKKETPVVESKPASKSELPASLKKAVTMSKEVREMPESLKKPMKKSEPAAPAAPVKKAASGFAAFMSEHKGMGYNMSQLSQMYRESKEEN